VTGNRDPKPWINAAAAARGNSQPLDGPIQRPLGRIRRSCAWVTASNGQTTRMSPAAERSSPQESDPESEIKSPANHYFSLAKMEIKSFQKSSTLWPKIAQNAAVDTLTAGTSEANFVQPKTFGCITGMQFFSMNSVPNCASDDGDNHSIFILVKVAFIAANLRNLLITFSPVPAVA
jgi:hypothetical protein